MEILLKDLFENFNISVRAYNVCYRVGLKTIGDARKHYLKYGSFLNVQNCGSKTNKELIESIEKFAELEKLPQQAVIPAVKTPVNHKLSDNAIKALVEDELDKLSVRARNGVLSFFRNKPPTKEQIEEYFIDKKFDFQKVKNIGKKSLPEVESFVKAAIDIFNKSAYSSISEQEKVFSTFYELVGFNVEGEFWLNKFQEKQIPIILFAAQHVSEIFELREVDTYIFKNHFGLLDKNYSLEEIASKYNVSKERIRQRRDKITPELLTKASKLVPLLQHSELSSVYQKKNIVSIPSDVSSDSIRNEINEVGTTFSAMILSALSNHRFYFICSLDKLERPSIVQHYDKYNSFKTFSGSYLVEESVISKIDLLKICSTVLNALSTRQESSLDVDIDKILGHEISDEGNIVVTTLVKSHFSIHVSGSNIHIPRNAAKFTYEYIHEALLKIGKPAHLSEIREVILNQHPEFDSSEEVMRTSLNNRKNIFIYFGRASTYGLKSWEKKNGFIKGGTIRNIVIEFLRKQDTACHISTITEQVRKYRKTDERSVLTNLKYTKKKIFFFERGGYVGLLNKNYATKATNKKDKEIALDELLKNIFQNKTSSSALM